MAKCAWCGKETDALISDIPLCVQCEKLPREARIKRREAAKQTTEPKPLKRMAGP
jgi:hypothetical protein